MVDRLNRIARASMRRRHRSRWRGCSRRSRGSPRFRATNLRRFEENIGAADIELTPDDLREIDRAASQIQLEGDRYPEALEQLTGR